MAVNGGNIQYSVSFKTDKAGLSEIKTLLQQIQTQASQVSGGDKLAKEFQESARAAKQLETILDGAWNNKLQQLNLSTLNNSIKTTYGSVGNLKKSLEQSGAAGSRAFNKLASDVLNTNLQLKQSSKFLDDMATSFANTVKWGISSSIFNSMTSSIQKAWGFTKNLDSSLNDIRIITGESAEKMEEFAVNANKAAKNLGASTLDYTQAALIYYQQGLSDEEVQARAETTLKVANVTSQAGAEVSEQLTAVWNGYKVSAEEAELYIDKLAAVAATTASDLEELSTGMSKVASAASIMGVDIDQLNAQLATIVSVTRQAPESVGTALKTIYARMGDIEAGLDSETTLGTYTEEMAAMGYNVLDANGKLRDMGEVVEEIGGNWKNMTREQQLSLSQTMAGTRQYNNLLALFDNWDMYTNALETSANAAGTLQEQQDTYMESTEAHLQQVRTELQRTYDTLIDNGGINEVLDVFTGAIDIFNDFIEGIGGGTEALIYFGSMVGNIFSKQIAGGINTAIENFKVLKENLASKETKEDFANYVLGQTKEQIKQQHLASGDGDITQIGGKTNDSALQKEAEYALKTLNLQKALTQEEYIQFTNAQREIGLKEREIQYLNQYKTLSESIFETENATVEEFETELSRSQESLEQEKERMNFLQREMEYYLKFGETEEDRQNAYYAMDEIMDGLLLTEEEVYTMREIQTQSIFDEKLTEEQIAEVLKIQEQVLNRQRQRVADLKQGAEGRKAAEDGTLDKLKQEQAAREKLLQQQQQQKEKQLQIQKAVQRTSAFIQAATAIVGSLNTMFDESATGAEKANAAFSGITGTASSIFNYFAPGSGILVQGIASLGKGILELTGLWDKFEDNFKSTEEKMEELHEQQQKIISDMKEYKSSISSLEEMAEEYEKLSEKAGEYDANISSLTEDERNRYNEIKDAILEYNSEALLAYSSEGDAILKKNEGIKETIELLKEQYELEAKQAFLDNFEKTQDVKENEVKDAKSSLNAAETYQKDLEDMDLEGIQNEKILDSFISLDNANFEGNTAVIDSINELREAYNKGNLTEDAINDFITDLESQDFLSENSKDQLIEAAEVLRDQNLNYAENIKTGAEEAVQIAQEGLKEAYQIDPSSILNALKWEDSTSDVFSQLSEQEGLNLDSLLSNYIGGLTDEDFESDNIIGEAKEKVTEYMNSLYEAFQSVENPDEFFSSAQIDPSNFNTLKEYNSAIQFQMNTLIRENKEFFESLGDENSENLLKNLFGVENIEYYADGLVKAVSTEYNNKIPELVSSLNEKIKEGITQGPENNDLITKTISEKDLSILSPDQIENFDAILGYVNGFTAETLGWDEALKEAAALYEDITAKQQFLADIQTKGAEYSEAFDIDAEQFENLAKMLREGGEELEGFSDFLEKMGEDAEDASKAAQELAKDILRYDKSVQSVTENSEEWMKILEDGNLQDQAAIIDDLADAYGNMFDIDGSNLSSEFLTSKENLELLQEAAKGSEEAYDQLQAKMGEDILGAVGLDTSKYQEDLNTLNNLVLEAEGMGLADLEAGASLNTEDYLQALTDMVDASGMTAEAATDYLSSMGVDAEVVNVPQEIEEVVGYNLKPVFGLAGTDYSPLEGTTARGTYPTVTYQTTPVIQKKEVAGTGLKVISANKSSGGAVKFANSSYGSGAGRRSASKGGGGGGGSSKPKTEKRTESKKDIYHDVNVRLEQLDKNLDDIGRDQEKLFGKDIIDSLNKELDILEEQRDVYQEKLNIARQEQQELRNSLAGQGVTFNADGSIANYLSIVQAKEDELNALIDQYNSLSPDAQDAFKENTLDPAKEVFDTFMEDIENYENLFLEVIPEIENGIKDSFDRAVEINIEKLNKDVELRLDLTSAQKDWDEFKRNIIDGLDEDDIFKNAVADSELFKTLYTNGLTESGTQNILKTIEEINKINRGETSDIFGTDKVSAMENLEENMNNLMGHLQDLVDLEEEIHQSYLDLVDQVGEEFDSQIESYKYVGDLIEHNLNLVELLKGEDVYAEMAKFYEQQEQNNLQILDTNRQAVEYYRQMMETETDPEAIEKWTEMWKDAVENLNSSVEAAVENIITKFENAIQVIFEELNDKLTDSLGLDYINQAWELQNENAEAYLDTVNSAFELQKLESKYLEVIDDSDSISAQRSLNKLMDDEMKKLREKDKLTQYDVERANALFELRLKEIALEEAQQNKTQMRLRRDASGNYTYQFVADQESIAQAQQEVDDARNSLYNMDRDQFKENQQEILDVYTEFQEKMKDAANLSEEERALIAEEYTERLNNLITENGVVRANLAGSAAQALADSENQVLMNEIVPNWDNGLQQMIDKMAAEGGFGPVCNDIMSQINDEFKIMNDSLEDIEETSGTSFNALESGLDTNIALADKLADQQDEVITKTIEEKDAVAELVLEVSSLADAYDDVYNKANNALTAAQALYEQEHGGKPVNDQGSGSTSGNTSSGSTSGSGSNGSSSGAGETSSAPSAASRTSITNDIAKGIAAAIWCEGSTKTGWGQGSTRKSRIDEKFGSGAWQSVQAQFGVANADNVLYSYWVDKLGRDASNYYYSRFNTGGYTGDWFGNAGKLAVLDKKELVLNSRDTENFLTAIGLVRDMNDFISSLNSSMQSKLANLSSFNQGFGFDSNSNDFNQIVQIEANFPNATSKQEIEDAFKDLVNIASQHAFNTIR